MAIRLKSGISGYPAGSMYSENVGQDLPIDSSRAQGQQVFDQMAPGEVYSPNQSGIGGIFLRGSNDPEAQQILDSTGYSDAMAAQRGYDPNADRQRLENIARVSQIPVNNLAPDGQQPSRTMSTTPNAAPVQENVDRYNSMSDTDKMALDMVHSGKMKASDWYKIKSLSEQKREDAMLEMAKSVAGKNPVDVNVGGQSQGITSRSLESLGNTNSGAKLEIGGLNPKNSNIMYDSNGNPIDKRALTPEKAMEIIVSKRDKLLKAAYPNDFEQYGVDIFGAPILKMKPNSEASKIAADPELRKEFDYDQFGSIAAKAYGPKVEVSTYTPPAPVDKSQFNANNPEFVFNTQEEANSAMSNGTTKSGDWVYVKDVNKVGQVGAPDFSIYNPPNVASVIPQQGAAPQPKATDVVNKIANTRDEMVKIWAELKPGEKVVYNGVVKIKP